MTFEQWWSTKAPQGRDRWETAKAAWEVAYNAGRTDADSERTGSAGEVPSEPVDPKACKSCGARHLGSRIPTRCQPAQPAAVPPVEGPRVPPEKGDVWAEPGADGDTWTFTGKWFIGKHTGATYWRTDNEEPFAFPESAFTDGTLAFIRRAGKGRAT